MVKENRVTNFSSVVAQFNVQNDGESGYKDRCFNISTTQGLSFHNCLCFLVPLHDCIRKEYIYRRMYLLGLLRCVFRGTAAGSARAIRTMIHSHLIISVHHLQHVKCTRYWKTEIISIASEIEESYLYIVKFWKGGRDFQFLKREIFHVFI